MKNIPLKTVEVPIDGQPKKLSYKAQLIEILRTPSASNGADYDEVRRSIRILDKLDETKGDTLQLEDADFEYMKQRVLNARWPLIDKYVMAFVEDVTK